MSRRYLVALLLWPLLAACPPPPTLEDPSPGAPDCGLLDPNVVLQTKLCPDQRVLVRNEGKPDAVQPGPAGGLTWVYRFASGDVFGQRAGFRFYDLSRDGKVTRKREEFLERQEK